MLAVCGKEKEQLSTCTHTEQQVHLSPKHTPSAGSGAAEFIMD